MSVHDEYEIFLQSLFTPEPLADEPQPARALRLLLRPAFDHEVCVTIAGVGDSASLRVRCLLGSAWKHFMAIRGTPEGNPARDFVMPAVSDERVQIDAARARDVIERASVLVAFQPQSDMGKDGLLIHGELAVTPKNTRFTWWTADGDNVQRCVAEIVTLGLNAAAWRSSRQALGALARYFH